MSLVYTTRTSNQTTAHPVCFDQITNEPTNLEDGEQMLFPVSRAIPSVTVNCKGRRLFLLNFEFCPSLPHPQRQ